MALETARLHPHKHKGLVSQDANVEISPRNGKSTQRTGTWRTLYLFLDKLYTRNFPSTYLCNYESSRYLHWTSYNQFPWKLKKKKKRLGKLLALVTLRHGSRSKKHIQGGSYVHPASSCSPPEPWKHLSQRNGGQSTSPVRAAAY